MSRDSIYKLEQALQKEKVCMQLKENLKLLERAKFALDNSKKGLEHGNYPVFLESIKLRELFMGFGTGRTCELIFDFGTVGIDPLITIDLVEALIYFCENNIQKLESPSTLKE